MKGILCALSALFVFSVQSYGQGLFERLNLERQLSARDRAVEKYMASMPEAALVAQLFLVNIEGNKKYSAVEKENDINSDFSDTPLIPGGCLFFSYNLNEDRFLIPSFIESIKDYAGQYERIPSYCAIDQEGGAVNRLRLITSALPSQKTVSSSFTPSEAYGLYRHQAREMKDLGFDMNLAPVCEASFEENRNFLQSRSFGNPAQTAAYSFAAIRAYEDEGIAACVKHFPGNSGTDPHTGLPFIDYTMEEMNSRTLLPFAFAFKASPSAVVMSHARISCLDSKTPACLSSEWIYGILKNRCGYDGLVISDDIFMAALEKNGFPPEKACIMALQAGVDVIMLSEKRFASSAAVLLKKAEEDAGFSRRLHDAQKRVIQFKIKSGILCFKTDEAGELYVCRRK